MSLLNVVGIDGEPINKILELLVQLNAERAREESTSHIRWLRTDYQIPLFQKSKSKNVTPTTDAPSSENTTETQRTVGARSTRAPNFISRDAASSTAPLRSRQNHHQKFKLPKLAKLPWPKSLPTQNWSPALAHPIELKSRS